MVVESYIDQVKAAIGTNSPVLIAWRKCATKDDNQERDATSTADAKIERSGLRCRLSWSTILASAPRGTFKAGCPPTQAALKSAHICA